MFKKDALKEFKKNIEATKKHIENSSVEEILQDFMLNNSICLTLIFKTLVAISEGKGTEEELADLADSIYLINVFSICTEEKLLGRKIDISKVTDSVLDLSGLLESDIDIAKS
jgi:hypothetical protein